MQVLIVLSFMYEEMESKEWIVLLEGAECKLAWLPGMPGSHYVMACYSVLDNSARGTQSTDESIIWPRSVTPIPSRTWKFKRQCVTFLDFYRNQDEPFCDSAKWQVWV